MSTEHHAREWFIAAALRVCHEYRATAQYRERARQIELLKDTLEIDVHAKLAAFFGTTANIFAQGRSDTDISVRAPSLEAEVKFLIDKRNNYKDVVWDWNWLLQFNNTNENFRKRAWVIFLPSTELFTFAKCQSVWKPKGQATDYNWKDIAPLLPFAKPYLPPAGTKQKLRWRTDPARLTVVRLSHGKKARVDLVGEPKDHLWGAIYTRLTPDEYESLKTFTEIAVADEAIEPIDRQFV